MTVQIERKISRRRAAGALLGAALLHSSWSSASAPLRILTGFPPGASLDLLARQLAQDLPAELGRPVVVENRTGASGRIANEALKSATPDGSTVLLAPIATLSIFPHAFGERLRYDPFRDFVSVAHVARFQIGFAVGKNVPAATLQEYVALARRDASVRSFGSSAVGSIPHFLGMSFGRAAGFELLHIPYRGSALAINALASGEISALAAAASDLAISGNAETSRLLAIAAKRRSPLLPEIPTFAESGYDLEGEGGYGLFVPAGTSPSTVMHLSNSVIRVLKNVALRTRLETLGLEVSGYGPAQLTAIVKEDYQRWGPLVRASGLVLTE